MSNEEIDCLNSFDGFLSNGRLNLTYEEYKNALRSSVKKPQVFLKRAFKDRFVNAFNPSILKLQRANMDIQFILDAYACCAYVVNYINKSHRGVSKLLHEAMQEVRNGNLSLKQRLQYLGNKFISASEISAQEASYSILGMPMSQCSNAEVFVNTSIPEKRVRMVKSRQQLQQLDPLSTNIYLTNILDRYVQRPDSLEDKCLAYFAAYYTYSTKLRQSRRNLEENQDYDEYDNTDETAVGSALQLKDGSGYMYLRKNPCILRFPNFKVDTNKADYFRSILML